MPSELIYSLRYQDKCQSTWGLTKNSEGTRGVDAVGLRNNLPISAETELNLLSSTNFEAITPTEFRIIQHATGFHLPIIRLIIMLYLL